jgi:quercetin dioxygenase-like cupin family protein
MGMEPDNRRVGDVSGSPFRTFNGVETHEFAPGVHIQAVGGEKVLVCRVKYEPGKRVLRHSHDHTEQVMVMLDGELTMTVDEETQTLRAGDTVVINRGLEHELYSEPGCSFIEALSPVPLDHVPDRERDLVLGPERGAEHVER